MQASRKTEPDTHTSIRDHFLADHRRLEDLIARLLEAFAANDREHVVELWDEFDAGLTAHLAAEEKHLIPALLKASERDARAIIQEHKHIRARLAELGAGLDLHIVRLDSARNFIDELRAHAAHEDTLLYRWGDAHLDAEERGALFTALAKVVRASVAKTGAQIKKWT